METKINKDAWGILSNDEKTAISLSLAHGKSSWQAGEIMSKAHFKYLEIQKRSAKFLEMFTNHFAKYGGLIPEGVELSFTFKEYLHLTIIERKNISEAVKSMDSNRYLLSNSRNKLITHEIDKLRDNKKEEYSDLYNLIMDFDRWNNFRILPMEIQEPSAFKRRNKARNRKHLKNITSLPKYSVLKVVEEFSYSGKCDKIYLPLVSQYVKDGLKILDVKETDVNISRLTSIGLFLFKEKDDAIAFGDLVASYFLMDNRNCKLGQKFWPLFRDLISKALNFKSLENIHKSRTYLDNAIFEKKAKVKVKKPKRESAKRVSDEKFY